MNILEKNNKQYLTWLGCDFAIDMLVKDYENKKYKCDKIYGISRGGLPIAVALSHRLNIPVVSEIWQPKFNSQTTLIVDDIADTGDTLKSLIESFNNNICYTLYYHKQSIVSPDKWIFEKKDKWIIFPWENQNDE